MISKTQTCTFKEHQELDPGWPAWPHCPYAGTPRTFPTGVPWYLSKTLACQVYQVLSSILSHPSPEYLVWFGDAMLPLGLGKGSKKHIRKKYGLLPNQGGGSARVVKKPNCFFEKKYFSESI